MEQSELEKFEEEMRTLQYRVEQSIRFFFAEQRALFLENFRSPNELRTSIENTVISGTGESRNTWHIYLAEQPIEFDIFDYLYIGLVLWLIYAVYCVVRQYNEVYSTPTYNSNSIRSEQVLVYHPLPNNYVADCQEDESQPTNVLLPPPNDHEEKTNDQGNENEPINAFLPIPNNINEEETNCERNENFEQQIEDINNTIDVTKDSQNVLNGNMQNENTNTRIEVIGIKNIITKEDNKATDPTTKIDTAEKLEPLLVSKTNSTPKPEKVTEIENPSQHKDVGVQTENEKNSKTSEKDLENGNQKESNNSSASEVTASKKPSEDKNDKIEDIKIDLEKVENTKIANSEKSKNVIAIITSDHDTNVDVKTDNENKEAIETGSKNNVIIKVDQKKTENSSLVVAKNEDMKSVKENITKADATKQLTKNKNDDSTPKDSHVTLESSTLPSEIQTSNLPKSQVVVEPAEEVPKTEDKEKNISAEKDSKNSLSTRDQEKPTSSSTNVAHNEEVKNSKKNTTKENLTKKSSENKNYDSKPKDPDVTAESSALPLPTKIITSNLPKSKIVLLSPSVYSANKDLKEEDREKTVSVENDCKDSLPTSDEKKPTDSSTKISHNEEVGNAKENTTKENVMEKPSENKNVDCKSNDSNVSVESTTTTLLGVKNKDLKKEDNEKKCSVEIDSKDDLSTSDKKELTDSSTKILHDKEVNNTKKNVTEKPNEKKNVDSKPNDSDAPVELSRLPSERKVPHNEQEKNAKENTIQANSTEKDLSSVVESNKNAEKPIEVNIEPNVIEKLGENENDDIKKNETNLAKKIEVDNIEESKPLPSENKTINSQKSNNFVATEITDDHTDEVVKTENIEKKDSIQRESKDVLKNKDQEEPKDDSSAVAKNKNEKNVVENIMETNTTEKLSENKNNINTKEEIGNIEESEILTLSENKTSDSSKSQNSTETPNSHKNEIIKTKDGEKKDSIDKDLEDGSVNEDQENSTISATDDSAHNNDDNKEDEGNLRKENQVDNIEVFKTLPNENKTKTPDHTDEVLTTEDKEKKDLIEKDSEDDLKNQDQEDSKDSSSEISSNENVKNAIETTKEACATEIFCENKNNDNKGDDGNLDNETKVNIIEETKTLSSESKTSNSPKSQNVTATETTDIHADEVVETKDADKKNSTEKDSKNGLGNENQEESKDFSSVVAKNEDVANAPENNMNANATEKFSENKNKSNTEEEIDNIEESKARTSKNKTSDSPRSQNEITETPDSHKNEIVKTEDEEKTDSIDKHLEDGSVNKNQENSTISATDDGALEKESEADIIEAFETLPAENKTSSSPKTENVSVSRNSKQHTDEVAETGDDKNKSIEKDLKDNLMSQDQDVKDSSTENVMETNEAEIANKNKIDKVKENEGDVENEKKRNESTRLPSDSETSNSSRSQNVITTETSQQQTDEVAKTKEDQEDIKSSSSVVVNEENVEAALKDSMEDTVTVTKTCGENMGDENVKNSDEAHVNEKSTILSFEDKISNSSELENATVAEILKQHIDDVVKTEEEEKKETIEEDSINDLMNTNQQESKSSSSDIVDNMEVSKIEKPNKNKIDLNMENIDDIKIATETFIIEESKRLRSETSTVDQQEEKIGKGENVEEKLEKEAEKAETNATEDEDHKVIQSEDCKEGLSNVDKISTESESGDAKENKCDIGPANETINIDKSVISSCESKIGDISNSQSETKIKPFNFEDNEIVITQNEEGILEIRSKVVEVASKAIEAKTNAATNVFNENEIENKKLEKDNTEAADEIENNSSQDDTFDVDQNDTFDVNQKNASSGGSDTENQASGSTANSSGNDQLLGGQRKSRRKKKGKKSKYNRY